MANIQVLVVDELTGCPEQQDLIALLAACGFTSDGAVSVDTYVTFAQAIDGTVTLTPSPAVGGPAITIHPGCCPGSGIVAPQQGDPAPANGAPNPVIVDDGNGNIVSISYYNGTEWVLDLKTNIWDAICNMPIAPTGWDTSRPAYVIQPSADGTECFRVEVQQCDCDSN